MIHTEMEEKNIDKHSWTSILVNLAEDNVDFVVVGGAALSLHGLPRTTLDLDIYIAKNNIAVIFEQLQKLGLTTDQESLFKVSRANPALTVGQWVTFKDSQEIDLIDVFIEDSITFSELLINAEDIKIFDSIKIKVASLTDIKQMKEKINRPIDKADIALIDEFIEKK
ncbi:MAG: nucleotidyltransferase [Verrucomicrobiota bacterium]|nr:nucleotidyltransferase [Verrucomicrobiota bacterium]